MILIINKFQFSSVSTSMTGNANLKSLDKFGFWETGYLEEPQAITGRTCKLSIGPAPV